ncbi:hypothetical protein HPB51_013617 [Rhipicephalus microplus]|uniref:Uncharacterized protein n=1 Tax=Rhipicephalus microplus TaxID=6941 RepID=A0A9J6EH31_RHIMP|nr:hypothetical protein HPB51_013617 [Rhipicephalus microplus]
MKRTEKNRLLLRIKLRPPQHWWKAKRVRTSVATQENAPVYMNHLRTNTSRTPMRRREMMVAVVQLQVIFVLQSTLGKVTPLLLAMPKEEKLQGALRKYCVVFASECAGKGEHQRLGCFVTKEFTNYKKAMDAFKSHASSSYHAMSTALSENILAVRSRSQHDILTQLDHGLKKQVEENRKNLLPIIETILFCGRQEVPLRGTDDSGPINMSEVLPFKNDGNFRALLRMRAKCGDAALRAHMETSPANVLYTSPKIQNELITLCGKIIQRKTVENVNSGSCFSVLADEATDIFRTTHISLCVRYVGHDTSGVPILEEDFVDFVPLYDLTGKALSSTILNSVRGHGFDLNLLCGQGHDGTASMSGHLNGVQAFIRQTAPKAFLLSILATLPVSTSTPERTFFTLRRLKSYLRNRMNNDRLAGLALLSIHRELQVTPEQVLTEFCKLPRRKNFLV